MKVIYSLKKIKRFKKPVVALGVFDGLHLAHRQILKSAVTWAQRIKGTSIVVTFWPHPQKEDSIYSLEHRLRLIKQAGIDICIVIKFNKLFSKISSEDFIKDILVKKLGTRYLYVGKNFRFGKDAGGNWQILKELSYIYNFKLKLFNVVKIDNQPISSTYIRKLIVKGELKVAQRLLSRPVSVLGTVIKGESLGRLLGFPTANINPHHEVLPPEAVYAVKIIFNQTKLNGICYIGTKPTFKARKQAKHKAQSTKHIEVYIFDFKKNIYGEYLELQFIKRIREEKKFSSYQSLVEQVKKDILATKALFSLP